MGCACNGNQSKTVYAWTNGAQSQNYNTEVEAMRRQQRDGGQYKPVAA